MSTVEELRAICEEKYTEHNDAFQAWMDAQMELEDAIKEKDLSVASVLSGNRNFEGRVHPLTKANFLASPPLVVAFAIAGTVNIDFEHEPIAKDKDGKDVYLREIWPSK